MTHSQDNEDQGGTGCAFANQPASVAVHIRCLSLAHLSPWPGFYKRQGLVGPVKNKAAVPVHLSRN